MRIRPFRLRAGAVRRYAWPVALLLALALPTLPQAAPDSLVIQGGTHIVVLNVVAKDKHGKPVEDLSRGDFVVHDNGEEQKIVLFALEDARETATGVPGAPASGTYTNRPGRGAAAVTVFLFDELNTRLSDQEQAKKDFVHYLRGLPATSRVAVFVLGDSLHLLHDFSQDLATLLAAMAKHSNRVNPEVEASEAAPASANSLTGDQSTSALWDSFIQASNQPYADYAETVRATRTAAALATIAGHLQGVPGRKALIWISGGFPIQLGLQNSVDSMPQSNPGGRQSGRGAGQGRRGGGRGSGGAGGGTGGSGSGAGGSGASTQASAASPNGASAQLPGTGLSFESDVARAIRALNEADVAVYPVDTRGVPVAPVFQADRSSIGKRSKPPKAVAPPDFNYETLETLAGETGGRAFHQINDLSSAIQEAASDARVSYALAFAVPAGSLDGSYHHLEVSVERPDVRLRYRPGYVAARDAAMAPRLAEAISNPVTLAGVGFSVHLDPLEGGYRAAVTIDPHSITLEPKDEKWTGALEFLVVVGKVEQMTTIPLRFSEATLHQVQERGLVLGARVKTPPGTTGFSIGFRDVPSGRVGTLHIPL
ncbi:MAG: VWA domain-containing protein [Bryobacteraceae bacterium]